MSRDKAKCTHSQKDFYQSHACDLGVRPLHVLCVCVCVYRVMEEEEERRQQTAMEVRLKKEKSEEILKERENAVRKVLIPAYSLLLVK